MLKMKWLKKAFILLVLLALGFGFYRFHQTKYGVKHIAHYSEAERKLAQTKDQQAFEKYKKQLQDYYTGQEYENEIRKLTAEARTYFQKIPVQKNSIVLFDVDDTALYNWHPRGDFIWNQPKFAKMKQQKLKPAIEPILVLYKFLLDRGFKLVFITSRSDNDFDNTQNELINAGYSSFYKLILMPIKLAFDPSIKTADWKLGIRKELAKKYDIVGSVGDRPADFEGGYTGYKVRIPNYLY